MSIVLKILFFSSLYNSKKICKSMGPYSTDAFRHKDSSKATDGHP